MNHRNEIKAYLSIYGDTFDPTALTKLLQLQPIHTHIQGHEIPLQGSLKSMPGKPQGSYKETAWDYGSDYINTYDSEDALQIVENAIKDKVDLINDFVQKHNLHVKLYVVPYLDKRPTRSILGIGFSRSFIEMLSNLNAEIDMDMYLV